MKKYKKILLIIAALLISIVSVVTIKMVNLIQNDYIDNNSYSVTTSIN